MDTCVNNIPYPRNKAVVHIPVRAGSTRIKNKNIIDICGHPLLAYTIKVAKAAMADRVIVNTDSEEIAEIARSYGAEAPFLRPKALSNSKISPYFAAFYAKRWLIDEEYPVDLFIDMYATNPFRNVETIKNYIDRAKKAGIVFTRARINFDTNNIYTTKESLKGKICNRSAQEFSFFKLLSSFLATKMCSRDIRWHEYATITNPLELIDIDSTQDLSLVRYVIKNNIYDFGVTI